MDSKLPADCEYHLTQLFQTPELRTEIRAYLRHRLFTSIQNSSLGPSLARRDVQPVSPKLQTLNLLVAEYLLCHHHHFTLSVFACEVPSVSCLCPTLQDALGGRTTSSAVPFRMEDVQDMLQSLGLGKSIQLLQQRYNEHGQALLECLVRALPELSGPPEVPRVDQGCCTHDLVIDSNPVPEVLVEREKWQQRLQEQTEMLNSEHGQFLKDVKSRHAQQLEDVTTHHSHQLEHLRTQHNHDVEDERSRHAGEEQRLRKVVNSLQQQLNLAQHTLAQLRVEREAETEERNRLNAEQEQQLQTRLSELVQEEHKLERERLGLKKIKKKLQTQQKQLDEVSLALTQQAQQLPLPEMQELSQLRAEQQTLREENQTLRALTEHQRLRIEHLNVRLAELVSELHLTRENLSLHSTRQVRESLNSTRQFRSSSDGSDSSPTDDVVRDAKRRIKTLEEEFEAIGRYHKHFQARHLNESLVSSVLGSSNGQMFSAPPFDRHVYEQGMHSQTYPPPIPKLPAYRIPRQAHFHEELVIETPKNTYHSKPRDTAYPSILKQTGHNLSPQITLQESQQKVNKNVPVCVENEDGRSNVESVMINDMHVAADKTHFSNLEHTSNNLVPEHVLRDSNVSPKLTAQREDTNSVASASVGMTSDSVKSGIYVASNNEGSSAVQIESHMTQQSINQSAVQKKLFDNIESSVTAVSIETTGHINDIVSGNTTVLSHNVSNNVPTVYAQALPLVNPDSNLQVDLSNPSPQVTDFPDKHISTDVRAQVLPLVHPTSILQADLSSSSSSKHISAGLASPKGDDDFWDL